MNIYRCVKKEMGKAVVDTGLQKMSTHRKNKEDDEKEYVLDPSPPRLTLGKLLYVLICEFFVFIYHN